MLHGNLLIELWTVVGLCIFEIVSSLDNAIMNAQVLGTMSRRARTWFLFWGMLSSVFLIRGLLPWLIVWIATPGIGFNDAFIATLRSDPHTAELIHRAAPMLLCGGGVFLCLLWLHWLFLEEKTFGLPGERFIARQGIWFYAAGSFVVLAIASVAQTSDPGLGLSALVGSSAFFFAHGLKEQAEKSEQRLVSASTKPDIAKILFLIVLDACFSIDGVIGAFGFTISVPLILIGNGLGALFVLYVTVKNTESIKRYPLLKNGAMYSIGLLGVAMIAEAFGTEIPSWVSPTVTIAVIGYFFWKSLRSRA